MAQKMKLRAGHTDLKVYPYKLDKEAEFLSFCHDVILPWLRRNGATQADFWTFRQAGVGQLIVALNDETEWDGINGIKDFLLDPSYSPDIKQQTDLQIGRSLE